jgi:hypothetical protein
MELCNKGNLRTLIADKKGLDEEQFISILTKIVRGLKVSFSNIRFCLKAYFASEMLFSKTLYSGCTFLVSKKLFIG